MRLTISDIRFLARMTQRPVWGFLGYQLVRGYNRLARCRLVLAKIVSPAFIHPSASIHPSAILSNREVTISPEVMIEEGAIIRGRTDIGLGSRIGEKSVIGETGFQIYKWKRERLLMIHTGRVSIGDRVIITNRNHTKM